MDESRLWGTVGVLLALAGVGIIAQDHHLTQALTHGSIGEPIVLYGVGVAFAAVVTALVVGSSMLFGK
jgi:hypothetical protein